MDTITREKATGAELKFVQQTMPAMIIDLPVNREGTKSMSVIKRFFDVILSSFLIITVLSWLYLILFVLIKATSRGSTLFIQKRVGYNGEVFNCLKFRTMVLNDKADIQEAVENDERITVTGKWLRKTGIDELPQLINVLMGDMSIVGPRPHMLSHHQTFITTIPGYNNRHQVKPGITGLAQVKGYHGSIVDHYSIYGRTRLDLFYVKKATIALDTKIFFRTIAVVFIQKKSNK